MDNNENLTYTPDEDISLDSILAEYEAERALEAPRPAPVKLEGEESNHIVYDSREQAIGEAEILSVSSYEVSVPLKDDIEVPETVTEDDQPSLKKMDSFEELHRGEEPFFENDPKQASFFESVPKQEAEPAVEQGPEADETRIFAKYVDAPVKEDVQTSIDELIVDVKVEDSSDEEYATAREYERPERERQASREPDFKEKVLGPIIGLMAASAIRRDEKRKLEREKFESRKREEVPELRADKAAALYAAQADSTKIRCYLASVFTLVLAYLSFGLPAMGLLGKSPAVRALVCLILMLVVVVIGLDIFTKGIMTLIRKKPGAESLIAISAVVSTLDAVLIVIKGGPDGFIPFCGVTALSMTFAIWGSYLSCKSFAMSFASAAATENPSVVLSLSGIDEEGGVLAKSKRPITGFVRTAEAADVFESAYRIIAPILMGAALILSAFCFFASKECTDYVHTLAACTAACGSLSALFGFAFPFSVLVKRLVKSGVAIAGYAGTAELGRIRRVLVTDTDIFPVSTLSIADVSIAESARPDTVIAYTGSLIAASGMGIAPLFTELMRKNACSIQKVEDFACHEGGGLVARVNGDLVYVGSSGFMQLMGIRLPKGSAAKSSVFVAINDSLSGIFAIGYKPVASVQRALVSLLRSKKEPLFAIRDFNITPMLVKQKFRLPNDRYDFPSFADRYRISAPETEELGTVVATFARGGLNSVAGLASRGQKLYTRLIICLVISLLGTFLGLVFMLYLCWTGAYDSASCGNLMIYMLLWMVPVGVVSLGLRN